MIREVARSQIKDLPERSAFAPQEIDVNEQMKDVIVKHMNLIQKSKERIGLRNMWRSEEPDLKSVKKGSKEKLNPINRKRIVPPKKRLQTGQLKKMRTPSLKNVTMGSRDQLYNPEISDNALEDSLREMKVLSREINEIKVIKNSCAERGRSDELTKAKQNLVSKKIISSEIPMKESSKPAVSKGSISIVLLRTRSKSKFFHFYRFPQKKRRPDYNQKKFRRKKFRQKKFCQLQRFLQNFCRKKSYRLELFLKNFSRNDHQMKFCQKKF